MSEHTPGPWAWENYQGTIHVFVDNEGGTPSICKLVGPDKEANARLIAAAPLQQAKIDALLAACKAALDDIFRFKDAAIFGETMDMLETAIALAEGEE